MTQSINNKNKPLNIQVAALRMRSASTNQQVARDKANAKICVRSHIHQQITGLHDDKLGLGLGGSVTLNAELG